jgi:hypothetical protein
MIPVKRKCLLHLPHDGKEYPLLATCTDETSRQRQCVHTVRKTARGVCMCFPCLACLPVVPVNARPALSGCPVASITTVQYYVNDGCQIASYGTRYASATAHGRRRRAGPCKNVGGTMASWPLDFSTRTVLCCACAWPEGRRPAPGPFHTGRRTRRPLLHWTFGTVGLGHAFFRRYDCARPCPGANSRGIFLWRLPVFA